MGRIKLFCIPHAGASAYYYLPLKKYLNNIDIEFVELKGRGKRFAETAYISFDNAVDDIFQNIKNKCNGEYGIYGHSMGSWLAYELYYKLLKNGQELPKCIFFSGREAPCDSFEKINFDHYTDEDLEEYIRDMGGMGDLERVNKEIRSMFFKIIKSDFKILNDYIFKQYEDKIISKSIIIAGNKETNLSYKKLSNWGKLIEDKVLYISFKGGHFYMNNQWRKVSELLQEHLVFS